MSEKVRAAAQRINPPFVDVAAYSRRRIYKVRDFAAFQAKEANACFALAKLTLPATKIHKQHQVLASISQRFKK